jgi:hypothetical protein
MSRVYWDGIGCGVVSGGGLDLSYARRALYWKSRDFRWPSSCDGTRLGLHLLGGTLGLGKVDGGDHEEYGVKEAGAGTIR